MDDSQPLYQPPLALTVLSSISIGTAGLCSCWIMFDIIQRKGWKSMMAIMIPVYIINALYLWPITLWTYLKYGRPIKPQNGNHPLVKHARHPPAKHAHHPPHAAPEAGQAAEGEMPRSSAEGKAEMENSNQHHGHDMARGHHGHGGGDRPMFATITVAVCHCGAGCVLGDLIGEWLVYGTTVTINGRGLWPEFLIDFAFAIAFGIVFQYFSIAPMAGAYGPKTVWRAAKADILSLLFFEIGLFGWMAIFQIGIFGWRLPMDTVTYWWMMQIGMFLGHWTAFPINWWLIKEGIKEPCA